ncbi:DNA topoisomerase III [Rodentibacter caecimuris]|uniref:DNA topoisomerase III n=1 Tax=Rodentibacter caecimuris TaxID=1796644 RepID=UPI0013A09739|nr:DNA topoisomerase III [Rodentibacter heylii]QIA76805.1 DNA topoisomerase III [Rodentibacter heylii]
MKLFLCEKPSQGNDIAKVLGATKRGEGCLSTPDGQLVVSWGIGHLVEQFNPEQYDPAFKKWAFETLPIIPSQWGLSPKKETKKQYSIVIKLIKQAQLVVIATDIDREGETIARELLDLAKFRGQIKRLWLSALDDASIRKALGTLKNNEDTLPLYYAGLARSRADWLIGMNFSRLFTLLAQQKGYQGKPLSVGRVQSPTLSLVVNRDREIKNFIPKQHFTLQVILSEGTQPFVTQYVIPEQYCDADGLCLSAQVIQTANQQIRQIGQAKVESVETKREKQSAPLLFALSDLQSEANRLYGLGAQQVLDIAQSLYETHKATTYPRTDCGYLPESQLAEAPRVIHCLIQSDSRLQSIASKLNLNQKSRAWNDKKITAHHGIIPTMAKVDINKMSEEEFKLYDLIRRRYLAQFLPVSETDKTQMTLKCGQHVLAARGNVLIAPGWKILFGKTLDEEDESKQALPTLTQGQTCRVVDTEMKTQQTTPPNHFTEGTLLTAMKNAARFVTDERLKQRLRETEGLGTEATRAGTIQGLIDKGFLAKKGKSLIATNEAVSLIDNLPVLLKDPGLTALWEQALNQIAEKTLSLDVFMQRQEQFIRQLMKECLAKVISLGNIEIKKCSKCGSPMIKREGKNGLFWGCSQYPKCDGLESIGGKLTRKKKVVRERGNQILV